MSRPKFHKLNYSLYEWDYLIGQFVHKPMSCYVRKMMCWIYFDVYVSNFIMKQRIQYFAIWALLCNIKWKQRKFCIPGNVGVTWH